MCMCVCVCACLRAGTCVCGFCLSSDGIMLIVKAQAEADAAIRSDMDFLELVLVILHWAIFAIPILYSFMEEAYSALVEKWSSMKYTDIDQAQESQSERSQISPSMSLAAAEQETPGNTRSDDLSQVLSSHAEVAYVQPVCPGPMQAPMRPCSQPPLGFMRPLPWLQPSVDSEISHPPEIAALRDAVGRVESEEEGALKKQPVMASDGERESASKQNNLRQRLHRAHEQNLQRAHAQEITNYQQELGRLQYEYQKVQKELQQLKDESKNALSRGFLEVDLLSMDPSATQPQLSQPNFEAGAQYVSQLPAAAFVSRGILEADLPSMQPQPTNPNTETAGPTEHVQQIGVFGS